MSELLTMQAIAKALDIPESTARYFRDKYSEYIPSVGRGRNRRYEPGAIDVLRIIANGSQDGRTADEIREHLDQHFRPVFDIAETSAATQQQSINAIQIIQDDIESRRELAQAIKDLTAVLKEIQQPIRRRSFWDIFRKGKH